MTGVAADDIAYIEEGQIVTCGLLQNGTAMCWGYAYHGATGVGTVRSPNMYTTPRAVMYGYFYSKISLRVNHACGLRVDATIWCWCVKLNEAGGWAANIKHRCLLGYNLRGFLRQGERSYCRCRGYNQYSQIAVTTSPMCETYTYCDNSVCWTHNTCKKPVKISEARFIDVATG